MITPDELLAKVRAAGADGYRLPDRNAGELLACYQLVRRGLVAQSPIDPWTLVVASAKPAERATFRLATAMASTRRGRAK